MAIEEILFKDSFDLKKKFAKDQLFIAEIDGKRIETLEDYMKEIIEVFKFPKGMFKNLASFDSYNDWMRDLTWLGDNKGYILFLFNEKEMLKKYPKDKETIFELFSDYIIPFWNEEVKHVVVEGKTKIFDIFIVE